MGCGADAAAVGFSNPQPTTHALSQPLSHQKPKPLLPTLSTTVIANHASSCSKSDFVCNRSNVLGILQAHTGHLLPFNYNSSGYRIEPGCKKTRSLLFHSSHSAAQQKMHSRDAHHICLLRNLLTFHHFPRESLSVLCYSCT